MPIWTCQSLLSTCPIISPPHLKPRLLFSLPITIYHHFLYFESFFSSFYHSISSKTTKNKQNTNTTLTQQQYVIHSRSNRAFESSVLFCFFKLSFHLQSLSQRWNWCYLLWLRCHSHGQARRHHLRSDRCLDYTSHSKISLGFFCQSSTLHLQFLSSPVTTVQSPAKQIFQQQQLTVSQRPMQSKVNRVV